MIDKARRKKGRILTIKQLEKAGACEEAIRKVREAWGEEVVVDQATALWASTVFDSLTASWCAWRLLPRDWAYDVYNDARMAYDHGGPCGPGSRWSRISWAAVAAAYVEAGK